MALWSRWRNGAGRLRLRGPACCRSHVERPGAQLMGRDWHKTVGAHISVPQCRERADHGLRTSTLQCLSADRQLSHNIAKPWPCARATRLLRNVKAHQHATRAMRATGSGSVSTHNLGRCPPSCSTKWPKHGVSLRPLLPPLLRFLLQLTNRVITSTDDLPSDNGNDVMKRDARGRGRGSRLCPLLHGRPLDARDGDLRSKREPPPTANNSHT